MVKKQKHLKYKIQYTKHNNIKLKIEEHELHQKLEESQVIWKDEQTLLQIQATCINKRSQLVSSLGLILLFLVYYV